MSNAIALLLAFGVSIVDGRVEGGGFRVCPESEEIYLVRVERSGDDSCVLQVEEVWRGKEERKQFEASGVLCRHEGLVVGLSKETIDCERGLVQTKGSGWEYAGTKHHASFAFSHADARLYREGSLAYMEKMIREGSPIERQAAVSVLIRAMSPGSKVDEEAWLSLGRAMTDAFGLS